MADVQIQADLGPFTDPTATTYVLTYSLDGGAAVALHSTTTPIIFAVPDTTKSLSGFTQEVNSVGISDPSDITVFTGFPTPVPSPTIPPKPPAPVFTIFVPQTTAS